MRALEGLPRLFHLHRFRLRGLRRRAGGDIDPARQVGGGKLLDHLHPVVAVIQAGDVGQGLAAGLMEFFFQLVADLVQRFQAVGDESRRQHHHMPVAVLGHLHHALVRIGHQPRLRSEARLEGGVEGLLVPAKLLAKKAGRLHAVAVIGVARHVIALGDAVEGDNKSVGRSVFGHGRAHGIGQRRDIGRVVMPWRHGADGGLPAQIQHPSEQLVIHRRRGRGGILRVERHHHDLGAASIGQFLQLVRDRRLAIAHGVIHDQPVLLEGLRQMFGLKAGDLPERRSVRVVMKPDPVIERAGFLRPHIQDDAVQDQPPERARHLDHTFVRQELFQVFAHALLVGALGRAEIDEKKAGAAVRREIRVV